MIDYLKLKVSDEYYQRLRSKGEWVIGVFEETGELTFESECRYGEILLKDKNGILEVHLSLPKVYNEFHDGISNNSGRFDYSKLLWTLEYLERKLEIPLKCLKIDNIEIGINIFPEGRESAIWNHAVNYRGKSFGTMRNNRGIAFGKRCTGTTYETKIYDKRIQYGLDKPEIRFELKVFRMRFLKDVLKPSHDFKQFAGVLTPADLKDKKVLLYFRKQLFRVFGEILFYEPINDFCDITEEDLSFIVRSTHPIEWEVQNWSKNEASGIRRRYQRLVNSKCQKPISKEVYHLLWEEYTLLLNKEKVLFEMPLIPHSIGSNNSDLPFDIQLANDVSLWSSRPPP